MEKISVIVPCYNRLDLTQDFVMSAERTADDLTEFVMVDNHSDDGTDEYLGRLGHPFVCHRNTENIGMVGACIQGAYLTESDILVFMHNDVFLHASEWPKIVRRFFSERKDAGIVGLYGAACLRRDGSFLGRGIVHAKAEGGNLVASYAEVAVVDGLFMATTRMAYEAIGGFDHEYMMHYYDKDICLKSRKAGYRNYVLNIPFTHRGAGTRSSVKARADNEMRDTMKLIFLRKWKKELPLDVRNFNKRIRDLLRKYA